MSIDFKSLNRFKHSIQKVEFIEFKKFASRSITKLVIFVNVPLMFHSRVYHAISFSRNN